MECSQEVLELLSRVRDGVGLIIVMQLVSLGIVIFKR